MYSAFLFLQLSCTGNSSVRPCWATQHANCTALSRTFASSRAICVDPSLYSDLTCRKEALVAKLQIVIPPTVPIHRFLLNFLYTPMLSFVLLQLEPPFRYDSREWLGLSNCVTGCYRPGPCGLGRLFNLGTGLSA
ncbi:BZ3500_MvSof-1268-A1-R1_Chr4-3g07239 [Microbotryum saponariae]|uniref:BZ3500_MvSof-1268-A1-R1_Chr4-3g07239 protein n=1 Tax=Microbotryum saponariae TaxID=289078 RepID=A0A2X0LFA8_9BASI|nr:BZ3500_MvSof-1268-A1-R1_Chr4-3g07239 [Microbotryum saponariae]SDA06902.1 BZ3501_MvSof-1269-A2-R1_Chr4-2g06948 [Microbotryum saponariae]